MILWRKNNMIIREVLEEAGRYYGCFNIIHNIINDLNKDINYPCPHKDNDGKRKERIKGKLLIDEASKLLTLIQSNQEVDRTKYDFDNLRSYISFQANIMLHNYAIDISHHNTPCTSMETIRDFLVLENLLDCWCISDDKFFWTIPETWKKNTDLCEKKEEKEMDLRNDLINFANDVDDADADMAADKFTYLLHEYNYEPADTSDFPELREEYVICRDIERGQTIKLLLAERETFFILALQDTVKYKNSCCYSREVFYIYK